MRQFKLSAQFMLLVLSMAAIFPALAGVSILTVASAIAVVVAAAFLIQKTPTDFISLAKHPQAGEVGEDLRKVEAEYKNVTVQLAKISDDLKRSAEAAEKEIKNHQQLSGETREKVDKMLTEQGELKARLLAAEQALVGKSSGDDKHSVKTLGRHIIDNDEFKANARRVISGKAALNFSIHAAVTELAPGTGFPVFPQRVPQIVTPPQQQLFVRDLISGGITKSNSIQFVRESGFTNAADVVSENPANLKPESDIAFELVAAQVATIAHWLPASKQVLEDEEMLASYIDQRLTYGLRLKEEAQLLNGSGIGLNIDGIATQATAYADPGVNPAHTTKLDELRIAALQVQLANYIADGFVIHPTDWAAIETMKDTLGRYLIGNPNGTTTGTLWGLPVVASKSVSVGSFITGAWKLGAQLWDREELNITISSEDRDNFVKNMVTILAEERLALTVYRPEAFVKGPFVS